MNGGRYRVDAELGVGGEGIVYRARDILLNRDVALKLPNRDSAFNPLRLQRFAQAIQFLANVNHPNVVTLYDSFEEDGQPVMVMELVPGSTLTEKIQARRRFGPANIPETMAVLTQICDAVNAVHKQGLVHRDLKPRNIKLTPTGQIKVLDLGLSRKRSRGVSANSGDTTQTMMTAPGTVLGTLPYIAPEVLTGESASEWSDQFAVAVVTFELITGQRPFKGKTNQEIAYAILKEPPTWPSRIKKRWPELVSVINRALSKRAADRFSSILVFRAALQEALRLVNSLESRRSNPWIVGVAAAVLLAALALAAFALSIRFPKQAAQSSESESGPPVPGESADGPARYHEVLKFYQHASLNSPSMDRQRASILVTSKKSGWSHPAREADHGRTLIDLTPGLHCNVTSSVASPDGNAIAFHSDCGEPGVYVMQSNAGKWRLVAKNAEYPAWAPNSHELTYSNSGGLYRQDLITEEEDLVYAGKIFKSAWSETGRIAFSMVTPNGQRNVWVQTVGGNFDLVTNDGGINDEPHWDASGKVLLYLKDKGGRRNIFGRSISRVTEKPEGSEIEIISSMERDINGFFVSLRGRILFTATGASGAEDGYLYAAEPVPQMRISPKMLLPRN